MTNNQEQLFNEYKVQAHALERLSTYIQNDFGKLLEDGITIEQIQQEHLNFLTQADKFMENYHTLYTRTTDLFKEVTKNDKQN